MFLFKNHDDVAFSNSAVLVHFQTLLSILTLKASPTEVPYNLCFQTFV